MSVKVPISIIVPISSNSFNWKSHECNFILHSSRSTVGFRFLARIFPKKFQSASFFQRSITLNAIKFNTTCYLLVMQCSIKHLFSIIFKFTVLHSKAVLLNSDAFIVFKTLICMCTIVSDCLRTRILANLTYWKLHHQHKNYQKLYDSSITDTPIGNISTSYAFPIDPLNTTSMESRPVLQLPHLEPPRKISLKFSVFRQQFWIFCWWNISFVGIWFLLSVHCLQKWNQNIIWLPRQH